MSEFGVKPQKVAGEVKIRNRREIHLEITPNVVSKEENRAGGSWRVWI